MCQMFRCVWLLRVWVGLASHRAICAMSVSVMVGSNRRVRFNRAEGGARFVHPTSSDSHCLVLHFMFEGYVV